MWDPESRSSLQHRVLTVSVSCDWAVQCWLVLFMMFKWVSWTVESNQHSGPSCSDQVLVTSGECVLVQVRAEWRRTQKLQLGGPETNWAAASSERTLLLFSYIVVTGGGACVCKHSYKIYKTLNCARAAFFKSDHLNVKWFDGSHREVKPKHLDRLLVASCSIGHKPLLLHVSRWDMD